MATKLKGHIKNKYNAKYDETVSYEKNITSPNSKSSDNIKPDREHMDLSESGDYDTSTESESGYDDNSTESESGDYDNSTQSESGDDVNSTYSTETSTTEDVWDMILEVYNTKDYATKVSEYVINDYQNAEENEKRDMLTRVI